MDTYEHSARTWNQLSKKYEDMFMDVALYNDSYETFCSLIPDKNPSILELGCGPGNITRYMLNARPDFEIHACDVAPDMINLAKKNNPSATFEILDVRHISNIKQTYNAIICGFCVPYLQQNDCIKFIHDSYQLLKNNGLFYVSFIEGNYELSKVETSSDGQHSMWVYYYSKQFMVLHFEKNNFKIEKVFRIPYNKSKGEKSTHLVIIARKQ